MENNDPIFDEYLKKRKTITELLKTPRFWTVLVGISAALFLAFQYFLTVRQSLSVEELKASIDVLSTESMWVNKEVTPYGVTIVPAIRLKVRNIGEKPLRHVKFVGIFSFQENGEQMSDGFTPVFSTPLQPGETSEEILVRAFNGYKAKSKTSFIENKQGWKKIQVKLFARTNAGFAELGVYPIAQKIEGLEMEAPETQAAPEADTAHIDDALMRSLLLVGNKSSWIYKQVTDEEIVIVPAVAVEVKNVGGMPLHHVSFKADFEEVGTGRLFSRGVTLALQDPLSPGLTSGWILVDAEYGYTATSVKDLEGSKAVMKDLKVRLFAKTKESGDVLLGVFPVERVVRAKLGE